MSKKFGHGDAYGKMSWGLEWRISPWTGDFLVGDGEWGWVPPYIGTFTDAQNEEFAELSIGNDHEAIEAAAREWGAEYGRAWAGPENWDDETFEMNMRHAPEFTSGLNWPNFEQFLSNACFYGSADQKCAEEEFFAPYEGEDEEAAETWRWWANTALQPDGWLGQLILDAAQEAAYEETARRLAALEMEENA